MGNILETHCGVISEVFNTILGALQEHAKQQKAGKHHKTRPTREEMEMTAITVAQEAA